MKKFLTLALGSLMIVSCGLYNKYERPDVNATGLIRDAVSDVDTLMLNTDQNFGQLPWRELFTDPQLQGLIELALENNTDLRNAALNVQMMEDMLKVAKLAYLPGVAIAPSGTISRVMTDGASTSKTYQIPISASWNIDLFGNILATKRSAQAQLLMTKDYQVAVQTQIICGIANLYYTLMMLDEQQAIVTDMEKLVKETWDMMKLQMQLGRARSTSVQSAEASYYQIQTQAVDIKRQIRETENALSLLLNEAGHRIDRGSFYNQSLPEKFSAGVGIELLSNRADVHAAEMQLAQCFYDVESARSKFYPNITITGNASFTNNLGAIVNPGKLPARTNRGRVARGQGQAGTGLQHLAEPHPESRQRSEQRPLGLQQQPGAQRARPEAGRRTDKERRGHPPALHVEGQQLPGGHLSTVIAAQRPHHQGHRRPEEDAGRGEPLSGLGRWK